MQPFGIGGICFIVFIFYLQNVRAQSSKLALTILNEQNKFRSQHGVPLLKYNDDLSNVAQEWANVMAKDDNFRHRPNNKYGENLYFSTADDLVPEDAVKSWYDEIQDYDFNKGLQNLTATGHFTQLIWKDSTEVGIGFAKSGTRWYVVVNYDPPGNFPDKYPENVPNISESSKNNFGDGKEPKSKFSNNSDSHQGDAGKDSNLPNNTDGGGIATQNQVNVEPERINSEKSIDSEQEAAQNPNDWLKDLGDKFMEKQQQLNEQISHKKSFEFLQPPSWDGTTQNNLFLKSEGNTQQDDAGKDSALPNNTESGVVAAQKQVNVEPDRIDSEKGLKNIDNNEQKIVRNPNNWLKELGDNVVEQQQQKLIEQNSPKKPLAFFQPSSWPGVPQNNLFLKSNQNKLSPVWPF